MPITKKAQKYFAGKTFTSFDTWKIQDEIFIKERVTSHERYLHVQPYHTIHLEEFSAECQYTCMYFPDQGFVSQKVPLTLRARSHILKSNI